MHTIIHTCAGIPVVFAPMPDANSTTVEILVKAGSIYETQTTNGISHFLEHMFFKGGETYTTPQEVALQLDAIGAECNAFTGDDYAGYYIKSAPQYTSFALEMLADMLVHPLFPIEEIEKEKGVVIQEIMMYEDAPQQDIYDKRQRRYYGDNSFGRSTLGPVENIQAFSQTDLFSHKQSLYTKDNLIIVIAGAIEHIEQLATHITKLFAGLPEKTSLQKPILPTNHLPPEHQSFYDKHTKQNHLIVSAGGVSMHDPDRYACKMLGVILGGNMSSKLFQEVREKNGLCYYIHGSHHTGDTDGVFVINAGIEKARWEMGLATIYQVIESIAQGTISEKDFQNALGYLEGKTQMGIETSDQLAHFVGLQYLMTGNIYSLEQTLQNYEKVTLEQLCTLAKKISKEHLYAYRIQ